MKKLLFVLVAIASTSCTAASNGEIYQGERGCTYLKNKSSSQKITFVLQYGTVDYKYEKTVGPQEEEILGCNDDATTIHIVGAFNNNSNN